MSESTLALVWDAWRARRQGPAAPQRERARLAEMVAFASAHSPLHLVQDRAADVRTIPGAGGEPVCVRPAAGAEPEGTRQVAHAEVTRLLAGHGLGHVTVERADEPREQSSGGEYRLVIPSSAEPAGRDAHLTGQEAR